MVVLKTSARIEMTAVIWLVLVILPVVSLRRWLGGLCWYFAWVVRFVLVILPRWLDCVLVILSGWLDGLCWSSCLGVYMV